MQLKKRVCAVLAAVCCLGQMTLSAAVDKYPDWATIAMERWEACNKLDTAVPAGRDATRAEVAVLLDGVMPYGVQAENQFTDLPPEIEYAPAMLRLAKAGILQGSGGLMRPEATITRQEAAVMTVRAFGFATQGVADYADAAQIAPWAVDAVGALQEAGVMQGANGMFLPTAPITYAEVVVLLDNALAKTTTITGLEAHARHEEGVLAEGQPPQVNDGKFEITSVTKTEGGYRVEVAGTAALVGQQADADGVGTPAKAGKWMGIQLSISGLLTATDLQFGQEEGTWLALATHEALAPEHRDSSVMVYLNGGTEYTATATEGERTVTVSLRNSHGGDKIAVELHFVPVTK